MQKVKSQEGGFVLVAVTSMLAFLALAVISIMSRGMWQSNSTHRLYDRSSALHLAEAAVEQAAMNLRTTVTTDDTNSQTLTSGSYSIANPQLISPNLYSVTVTGTSDNEQRQVEAIFRLTAQSIFQFALFGDEGLSVTGNASTDSFDSSQGPYNNDPSDSDYNAGHNGDVGTNNTADDEVVLNGSAFIDGQLAVGYGATDPYAVVDGYDPLFITGGTDPPSDDQDVMPQSSAFPMPSVTVPMTLTCSDLAMGGNTSLTLLPTGGDLGNGEYCYNNVDLKGSATVTASGNVKVYITGELSMKGNAVFGNANDPTDMLVLMPNTGYATFDTGSTQFFGAMHAPDSTINVIGNAEIFGSVIADQINVSGSAIIHYDEAVTERKEITNTFTSSRVSWQEL